MLAKVVSVPTGAMEATGRVPPSIRRLPVAAVVAAAGRVPQSRPMTHPPASMRAALAVVVPTAGQQEQARTAVVWAPPTQVEVEEGQPQSAPVVLEVQAVWVPRAI